MKPRCSNQRNLALTITEVLVVVAMLAVLAVVLIPAFIPMRPKHARRVDCVNNLKQIGLAYRIWAGDHGDKWPMQTSVTNGGAMELVADGKNAWLNYLVMSNELSTPKILICPADTNRIPLATSFSTELIGKISCFVGLDANEANPHTLLSGDDNFEISGVPIKSGLLELSANAPIAWTAARHHFAGNIGLADCSVQEVTQSGLRQILRQTDLATNRLAIP